MYITTLLKKLMDLLKRVGSTHKKKLIFAAIMFLGLTIAKQKLKMHHIISVVMFFIKLSGNIMNLLPLPKYREYRKSIPRFQYEKQELLGQIPDLMNLNSLLAKIRKKEKGSLDELKFSIISGVVFSFVVYNAEALFNLVFRKYYEDFCELSAETKFEATIYKIKKSFKDQLQDIKKILQTTVLYKMIYSLAVSDIFDVSGLQKMFKQMLAKVFEEMENINKKVRKTFDIEKNQKEYHVAENYFKSTLQYLQEQPPSKLSKTLVVLTKPVSLFFSGIGHILSIPEDEVTAKRYYCTHYLYILPLKKYRDEQQWPNNESKYLNGLVLQQIQDYFNSINFNTFLRTRADFFQCMFMNRLDIYFKKKICTEKKKLLDLLPVFFKIIKEEVIDVERKEELHQRELGNAFKGTVMKMNQNITDIRIRNRILVEIYQDKQLSYLQRDMQIKYFNERQNMIIRPKNSNKKQFQEKDEIEEFLNNYQKAGDENVPKQLMEKMKQNLRE